MKRILGSIMASGLVLAAGLAFVPAESMAAATAAPVLSVVHGKMADGLAEAYGGKVFAADGINVYSAYRPQGSSSKTIKLVSSRDGGVTWSEEHLIPIDPSLFDNNYLGAVSIAVSGDAVIPTKRIVHLVWEISGGIYYSWADAANLGNWSVPLRMNVSLPGLTNPTIAATKTGKVFVKGEANRQLYLMISKAYDAGIFTEPTRIPVSTTGPVAGDSEIFVDNANNLHLSYPYCADTDCNLAGIKYTKLPEGGNSWSTPVIVLPPSTSSDNNTGLAAYDASNIYIASIQDKNLTFFSTTNGGTTWTKKAVFTKTSTHRTQGFVAVTVNAGKAITVGTLMETVAADGSVTKEEANIYRSTDGGASWSGATTVPYPAAYISLGVDDNGKVGIVTTSFANGKPVSYFFKEK